MKLSSISACALSFIVAIPVLVHADSASGIPLADAVRERSITIALWASAISVGLILIAIFAKNASNELKKLIFALLVTAIVGPTMYFIGSTINLNLSSIANGPVHWHADFEIIACGEELPPPNAPHKLSNKTGTPVLHQHVDKRYHVEGVVLDLEEVALDRFFEVQGGTLTENTFRVPTGDTIKTYINGDACPDGDKGVWNVFLYKVDEATHTATQTKLADYARYTPSAHELVPPGDCLIFEFGPERAYTDRLCNFHQIAVNKGELKIEVPARKGSNIVELEAVISSAQYENHIAFSRAGEVVFSGSGEGKEEFKNRWKIESLAAEEIFQNVFQNIGELSNQPILPELTKEEDYYSINLSAKQNTLIESNYSNAEAIQAIGCYKSDCPSEFIALIDRLFTALDNDAEMALKERINTSDWQTYQDGQNKFLLLYPKDWEEKQVSGNNFRKDFQIVYRSDEGKCWQSGPTGGLSCSYPAIIHGGASDMQLYVDGAYVKMESFDNYVKQYASLMGGEIISRGSCGFGPAVVKYPIESWKAHDNQLTPVRMVYSILDPSPGLGRVLRIELQYQTQYQQYIQSYLDLFSSMKVYITERIAEC